jgi:hypothetical protein
MTAEKRDPLLCTPDGVRPTDCTDSTTTEPYGTPITAELALKGDLRRPKAQPELCRLTSELEPLRRGNRDRRRDVSGRLECQP